MSHRHRLRLGAFVAGLAGSLVAPQAAEASNATHPRTPVLWTEAQCLTIIDRSRSATFPIVYTIPFEDTELTVDEVSDSRTHQFVGFCRDHHLEEILPSWLALADLAAADANGLGDAEGVDTERDVLDLAPDWAGCFTRITADDERRPITFEAAAEPVMWDTSALPAGTWAVEGYTYEPWANEWWPHPGVFKIIDDPDPAATGPAAALSLTEQIVEFGDEATITGCVDAMPGTTLTASYAISGFGPEPDWQLIMADVPASSGTFELSFAPPASTISHPLLIKIDVVDPNGRTWTSHANAYINVTEDLSGGDDCDEGGGFVGCEPDDGAEDETGTASDDSTEGDDDSGTGDPTGPTLSDAGEGGSCNCATQTQGSTGDPWRGLGGLGLGLGLVLVARRRAWRQLSSR
jgi:hypothetical protein